MVQGYSSYSLNLLLEVSVILISVFSTSGMTQCKPKNIPNLGIKLCQLKCNEHNLCSNFEYNIEDLPCRLSRNHSKKTEKHEGASCLSGVKSYSCPSKNCRPRHRCLETRSGKAIPDKKRNTHERCPQEIEDKMETQEDSPLHDACRNGYLGRVKRILSQGLVDVNSRGEKHRKTPLMLAAQEGHRQVFVFLVKKGANVSHIDQYGDNVLHLACRGGHISIVKDLVRHHMIDINSKGMYGSTPLLQTVYCGQIDVFHILVFCGANLSDMDDVGENILHVACRGGHFGMVKNVLKYYSDYINSRDNHGETPLMKAVSEGHIYVFDFLVSLGANVSHAADNGDNILHLASTGGHTKMVQYILSQDLVNINSRGKYGATPLMKAAHKGHMEIFKYLVGMKADVSQVDDDGDNILHYASIGEHTKIVQYILSLDLVDINSRGKYGRTALTRAVYYGQRKVLDLLASKGGLTNLVDAEGQSILHLASLGGRVEMVKYILSQNLADINARDNDGDTAAMIAKRNGKLDVYNFLVSQVVQ